MLKSKKLKRVFSIIMTSVFCMIAFAQTLYADEYALKGTISSALELMEGATSWNTSNNTGKINIKLHSDANGAIFTAYKLLNIANDGSGRLTVSIPTDAQAFWNEYTGKTSATVGDIKDEINSKTEAAEKSSDIINEFLSFMSTPDVTKPTGTPSDPAADGKTQITTEFGFYAILQTGAPDDGHIASAPVLACLPMQNPDNNTTWLSEFTIVPKDDTISVTKKVHASDESDFKDETITNIGDTVTYEIIAELPEYGADIIKSGITYTLEDKLPDGVMKDGTVKIELEQKGTAVFTEDTTLATHTYTPAAAPNPAKITVTFKDYKNDINKIYDKIKITYNAVLNKDAVIEGGGNINEVTLTYSSHGNQLATTTADAKVYTLGLDITKIDKVSRAALTGAEFEVHKQRDGSDEAIKFVEITGGDGVKRYRVATQAEINNGSVVTTIKVTDTNDTNKGKFMLDGLNNTTYWFKETKAPKDYNLPSALFNIEVKPTAYTDAENRGDYNGTGTELDFDDHRQDGSIQNSTGIDLPVTGGIGTILFTVIGLLLMAGAAYFLFFNRKKCK